MGNQPKLSSSKEVIAFLAERLPQCFSAGGEAHPLKIGVFQDLVGQVGDETNFSKTQLRTALRLYTSSWCYLYGMRTDAVRVNLDSNPYGKLEEQYVTHARQQLEEAKARAQTQHAAQQMKRREAAAAAGQRDEGVRRKRKPRPQQPRHKEGAEQRKPRPVAAKVLREERHTPVSDASVLTVSQALRVKTGNNAMDAAVLEVTRDGVRVRPTSGMSVIVRAEHLAF